MWWDLAREAAWDLVLGLRGRGRVEHADGREFAAAEGSCPRASWGGAVGAVVGAVDGRLPARGVGAQGSAASIRPGLAAAALTLVSAA